ncbi:hypothetical protein GCM10011586_35770 [Silvibacterium dinghuense]|nr:hypothetical protein GCM10011586_35770 [Silvibacterium dinghuense]
MNNNSSDRTTEVLELYQGQDRFRIFNAKKNLGLNAYKKLFKESQGDIIVTVDDDILQFPKNFDLTFLEYMELFPDYGYFALNVVQDERTNGAKPGPELYIDETRNGKTMQLGPAGGWCSCFRQRDFAKIRLRFKLFPLSMKHPEDGFITWNFKNKLKLKCGVIKDAICLHACGPFYAKQYDHLDREIAKYSKVGLKSIAAQYEKIKRQ